MSKTSIKVIKRKDTEEMGKDKTQDPSEPNLVAAMSEGKVEHLLHRKIADTVSNWIAERRENRSVEEISAIRQMFGSESLLSKTA